MAIPDAVAPAVFGLPDATVRLEAALGVELTHLLLSALVTGYRARPERDGRSAP